MQSQDHCRVVSAHGPNKRRRRIRREQSGRNRDACRHRGLYVDALKEQSQEVALNQEHGHKNLRDSKAADTNTVENMFSRAVVDLSERPHWGG